MFGTGHTVGNNSREQRLDRPQHRDRKRRANQLNDLRQRYFRKAYLGKPLRNAPKCTPDRGHAVELKIGMQRRHNDHSNQGAGDTPYAWRFRCEDHQRQAQER
ncbi:hypothetical protein D3C85_1149340 [compost metagenome]